jgi:hypothetical protein
VHTLEKAVADAPPPVPAFPWPEKQQHRRAMAPFQHPVNYREVASVMRGVGQRDAQQDRSECDL